MISNSHSILASKLELSKFVHLVCQLLELRKQKYRHDLVSCAILYPDQGKLIRGIDNCSGVVRSVFTSQLKGPGQQFQLCLYFNSKA